MKLKLKKREQFIKEICKVPLLRRNIANKQTQKSWKIYYRKGTQGALQCSLGFFTSEQNLIRDEGKWPFLTLNQQG